MRSLGQLLFDLLVNLEVLLHMPDLLLHLLVLEDQFLGLLRLELKLASQLMILEHSQLYSRVQLLFFEGQQVGPDLGDLGEHLVPQPVYGLHLLPLFVGKFPRLIFLVDLEGVLQVLVLMVHLVALVHVDVVVLELHLQLIDLALSDPPEVIQLPVLHRLRLF